MPTLTAALRAEYQALFDTCQLRPERRAEVEKVAQRILAHKPRYTAVGAPLNIPWHVVGIIHSMEGGLNFTTHLHNGDPLTARTRQVPKGRPTSGTPPFTWEASATDALQLARFDQWADWSVPSTLFNWERYNGWGYRTRHPEVKTPYLWSFTTHYLQGKYVKDGVWSPTAKSAQVGAAALLRRLAELGELAATPQATPTPQSPNVHYAPRTTTPEALRLQVLLNTFPGIYVREDGQLGPRSSDAFKHVFGHYLSGDPRLNQPTKLSLERRARKR